MPRIVAPRAHRSTLVCASLALSLACCSDDHTTKPATPQLVATDRQLTLGEPDVNGSFMLAIDTLPSGPIELSLTSDHPDLVALVPAKVTIDANTWQTPTRIDLIVSDDAIADGPRAVAVTVTVSAGDERFLAAAPLVIGASVADDDVAALVVGQASGTTTERRGQATFEVRLASEPRATVTIPVASSDPTEGVAGSDSLSFDASDWQTPKVVVVTGQDDDVADGAVAYHVVLGPTTSADPHYQGLEPAPVALSNSDDETAGILVSKPSGSAGEDGGRASLTVSLTAQPRDDVWLALASTDEGEGTVEFDRLRFTPVDWATEKAIYVNGVDDRVDDGDQTFEVTFAVSDTTDPDYALVPPVRVALTNKDDDSAAILATAPSGATSEAGATASFDIVLGSEPTSDVTLDLVSTDPGEGRPLLDRVHFTREDWDVPQTIAVAGQDDSLADGVQAYRIEASAVSADPLYAVTVMTPVELENGDDEHIGVTVGPLVGTPTEGGGQATFTLVLESQPSGAVTIPIAAELPDEVFVSAINVTFNELDWNAPKQVLLTGKDDSAADGPTAVAIHLGPATSPSDTTGYAGLAIPDVVVHNLDDDSAGVRVGAVSGSTSEAGATATFTVVLASRPSGDVTVPIASADPDEASAVPNAIVFTRDNWSAPRTVTLRGVDDELADGPQPVRIDIGPLAAPGETTGYDGMVVAPAATNNLDDDTAGVIVSAPSGTTTEVGGSATFTVALASRPLETVTLPIASSRESEAVAQPATLSFTPDDWAAPKTVTVTGQDDDVADGNQPFLVHIGPASGSAATGYDGLVVPPVSMANLDDDSAGISVSNLGGKATEAGGEAKFTIVLLGQPQADVTIALTSSDPGEALVAPSQLVFGADDWNAPKTVRVVGQDDPLADGSQPVRVAMRVTSADPGYAGFTLADVVVPVLDDDSAGVIVGAVVGSPSESGDRATFTVVLASRPTANVVVPVLSSRPLEGAARPAQLVFTSDDWSAPQTVTVTGQDDAVADGDQPLLVDLGPAQSSDETGYAGMAIESVALVNLDDDAAGISVGALVGSASEDGDAASFTLRLRTRPTAPVTIPLRVTANGDEIRLSPPGEVVFGPDNWASPQAVTATGKDDLLADGDQVATVALGPAESDDPAFDGMVITPASIDIVNRDDDSPGVTIADFQGTPSEAGGQATFTIALRSRPAAEVRIELSSSLPGEALVQPASIAFTAANWASPQLVITTGQDDAVADGNQPFTVRLALSSADPLYASVSVAPLPMVNLDDDSAGVVVGPVQGTASESGDQAVFSLALRSQPTASVTLTPSTNRPDEVLVPAPLTFTTANWSAPQLVVVRGVDDATADGNQIARIDLAVSSADLRYAAVSVPSSFVVDVDDDSAGLVVGDVDGQPSERGDAATFALRLASRPTAPVTVPLAVSLPAEAALQPGTLTFQPDEWSSPKLVTVTGVDDDLADGNRNLRVHIGPSSSDDARYQGLTAPSVPLVNRDDDSPSVLVGAVSGQTFEGDVDQHASFALRLGSRPTAEVRIAVTSLAPGEGTAQPALLTFAPDDWDAEQLVVVSGRDDAVADGDQRFAVALGPAASSDLGYDGLAIPTVQIVNRDDDSAGLAVSAPSGQASEAGGEASVSVRLTSRPTGNVVVPVSVSDASEAVATKAFLTFGPSNWDGLQSVSARGVDDDIADGNQPFQLVLGPVASADAAYAGIVAPPVALTNLDDDSAAVLASLPSRDVNEGGGQASFTIVLTSQPIAPVAVPVATTVNADEVLVAPTLLVFTPANWNAPQTVLVTGVDDAVKDGDQSVTLALGPATSSDARYAGASVTPPLVTLKNRDNDSAGVLVSDFQGAPNERGGQATFALALRSQPVGAVNIGLRTSDAGEGAVSPALVSFDAGDWSVPRLVTVTGVDDAEVDGNRPFSVLFDLTTSPDVAYAAVSVPPLALVNGDDDSAAVLVSGAGGQATEAGGEAVFSVSITTTPIGTVTIPLLVDDASEASLVGPSALVFSATDHAPREVRVRGVDDGLVDGDQPFAVRLGPVAAPDDPAYAALSIAPVWLTNRDDDAAAVIVSPPVGQPSEAGGSATFTVVLSAQPGGAVTVPTSSSDVSEGVVSTPSLSFTAADWSTPQTVTVTGVPDAIADGDVAFVVRLGPTASSDLRYHGLQPPDVRLVNRDDGDAVGIVAVLPPAGLAVAESGTSASFTLRLASQPVANVVLPLASSDVSEIVVQPTTLVFTASNWQTPQVVTVRGVDDRLVDGPATATIGVGPALSADAGYAGLTPGASIVATNADDDSGSVTATVIGQASEAGSAAYLTVALTAAPRDVVVLAIASGDAGEIAVSPPVVSFGANNWDVAQTVELRGVDDALADGPQATTITVSASSSDPAFAGKSATAIVTTLDDDSAAVIVSDVSGEPSEAGASATFSVRLATQPSAPVVVELATASDEVAIDGQPSRALALTPSDWAVPHLVRLLGLDDAEDDGDQEAVVDLAVSSDDPAYANLSLSPIVVTNRDDDTRGVIVGPPQGQPTEFGGSASFTVRLATRPTAPVSITPNSTRPAEAAVSGPLTFTAASWQTPQTVTVTGQDDGDQDGDQALAVRLVAAGGDYADIAIADVPFVNRDNDSGAGISVRVVSGAPDERGGQALVGVRLNSQPASAVTLAIASSDTGEGSVSLAALAFDAQSWSHEKTFVVTGVDDAFADGDRSFVVTLDPASSTDPAYRGLAAVSLPLANRDDDVAGVSVSTPVGQPSEAGASASFTVAPTSRPRVGQDLTVAVASSAPSEATVTPSTLVFTASDWAARTVTVTGRDDDLDDGDQPLAVTLGPVASADAAYAGREIAPLQFVNLDDDSAGLEVAVVGSATGEAAGAGVVTITVRLDAAPRQNVSVPLRVSDPSEASLDKAVLVLDAVNWRSGATATVTGQDDAVADGDVAYQIDLGPVASNDALYAGRTLLPVRLVNRDDGDRVGVSVSRTTVTTSEDRAAAPDSFTVVLDSAPTANVVLPLASSDPSEAAVSPSALEFTPLDWSVPRTVTVTGQDDAIQDGAVDYRIALGPLSSADPAYGGRTLADVTGTNLDHGDVRGVMLGALVGQATEAGGSATFTVALGSEPTAPVSIAATITTGASEAFVAPAALVFTAASWSTPQEVRITGRDDATQDGDAAVVVRLTPSSTGDYAGLAPLTLATTNRDDDAASVAIGALQGAPSESGGAASFTVRLGSQPSGDVSIAFGDSDLDDSEVTIAPPALVFTAVDWASPRTVTVTGRDDDTVDGDQAVTIAPVASGGGYDGTVIAPIVVTNRDDDQAGVSVRLVAGPTTEAGGAATIMLRLNAAPTGSVIVDVASSDPSEGSVATAALTFSAADWSSEKALDVRGVDDAVADGDQAYLVTLAVDPASTDARYRAVGIPSIPLVNSDDDAVGVTVLGLDLRTSETDGSDAGLISVALRSQPTAPVTVRFRVSDPSEASARGPSDPDRLTFTEANWMLPQLITVTGVDDAMVDGDVGYALVFQSLTSADAAYAALAPAAVELVNVDGGDASGLAIVGSDLETGESGGDAAAFSIALTSQPSAPVTLPVASSDLREGVASPATLVFTPSSWSTPQLVTVAGQNDAIDDGDVGYALRIGPSTSADPAYAGLHAERALVNHDDDTRGLSLGATLGAPDETGARASLTVALATQPTDTVTVRASVAPADEADVAPAVLTFTSSDWNQPRTLTVTGKDDAEADGAVPLTVRLAADDSGGYGGVVATRDGLTNADDDTAGFRLTPVVGQLDERGGLASFTLALRSQPTGDVQVDLALTDAGGAPSGEAAFRPAGGADASLLFRADASWSVPQTVVLAGLDDARDDGDQPVRVHFGVSSSDAVYAAQGIASLSLANVDDDARGVLVGAAQGTPSELGGSATIGLRLASEPTAPVTLSFASSDPGEGAVGGPLIFTPGTWDQPQTVTVIGVDDGLQDGDQAFALHIVASGGDYDAVAVPDVLLSNRDNDSGAGLALRLVSGAVSERGGQAVLGVRLDSQPASAVSIAVASSDASEGTVATTTLSFGPGDWSTEQRVTVTGQDDSVDDGDVAFQVRFDPGASIDPAYRALPVASMQLATLDDDAAGVSVGAVSGSVAEGGCAGPCRATFSLALTSEPTAAVTIAVRSSDEAEGQVGAAALPLVFTPDDWRTPRLVTVTGVDDAVDDGDHVFVVDAGPALSADASYDGRAIPSLPFVNRDDDDAGVVVTLSGATTAETGTTQTVTLRLTSRPTAPVTIPLAVSDASEASLDLAAAVFPSSGSTWRDGISATVTGRDDAIADGTQPYQLTLGPVASPDPLYAGRTLAPLDMTNADAGDAVGVVVSLPATPIVLSESAGAAHAARFTLALTSQPLANVTLPIVGSDASEAVAAPGVLVFTAANYAVPQEVTVTAVDDAVDDGDVASSLALGPTTSADPGYQGLAVPAVALTTSDDDARGLVLSGVSDGRIAAVAEEGTSSSFGVALASEPSAAVSVAIAAAPASEVGLAPTVLAFTPANWSAPQIVQVTGRDDALDDGDQDVALTLVASGGDYGPVPASVIHLENRDDDERGLSLGAVQGQLSEAGGVATFTVALASRPTAPVTISASSSDDAEGRVVTSLPLVIAPASWSTPRTITVLGQDDAVADGPKPVAVTVVASGGDYSGLAPEMVALTNLDDDVRGLVLADLQGQPTETGGRASFTLRLASRPALPPGGTVTVTIATSDASEASVAPAALSFDASDWSAPRSVTVSGVDDDAVDGNVPFQVTFSIGGADSAYSALTPSPLTLVNVDDDAAGATVVLVSGTPTEEAGHALFRVTLNTPPGAPVTLPIRVSDASEGCLLLDGLASCPATVVTEGALTFAPTDWDQAQTFEIEGVDDALADGDVPFDVVLGPAQSSDLAYGGLVIAPLRLVNREDGDRSGIVVTPSALPLVSDEATGLAQTFSVVLTSEPSSDVFIDVNATDWSEASVTVPGPTPAGTTCMRSGPDAPHSGLDPAGDACRLRFGPTTWSAPQVVTVKGRDDDYDDDDQSFAVVLGNAASHRPTTADTTGYRFIAVDPVAVKVLDDDTASIALTVPDGLAEEGGAASVSIAFGTRPTSDVTLPLLLTPAAARSLGTPVLSLDQAAVTVGDQPDWRDARTVQVRAADDCFDDLLDGADNDALVSFTTLQPGGRHELAGRSDSATVRAIDDDTAAVTVACPDGLCGYTSEVGGQLAVDVTLATTPVAAVAFAADTSATGGQISGPAIGFASAFHAVGTCGQQATLVLTGHDDGDGQPGDDGFALPFAGAGVDTRYAKPWRSLAVTNLDGDAVGLVLTRSTGTVVEGGACATLTVDTATRPFDTRTQSPGLVEVLLALPSAEPAYGGGFLVGGALVDATTVVVDGASWPGHGATVTLCARDDERAEPDMTLAVHAAVVATSDTTGYVDRAADTTFTAQSDDVVGILVDGLRSPTLADVVEGGLGATHDVTLASEPTGAVSVRVTAANAARGIQVARAGASPTWSGALTLTFDRASWRDPQAIVVRAIDDDIHEPAGFLSFDLDFSIGAPTGDDTGFAALAPLSLDQTAGDDDAAGIVALSGAQAPAEGACVDLDVTASKRPWKLDVDPAQDGPAPLVVDLGVPAVDLAYGGGFGTAGAPSATDRVTIGAAPAGPLTQSVRVCARDDARDDDGAAFTVTAAIGSQPALNGFTPPSQTRTYTPFDDDVAGLVIAGAFPDAPSLPALFEHDGPGEPRSRTIALQLNSEPSAPVTVSIAALDAKRGVDVDRTLLTFDGTTWSTPQRVAVSAIDDAIYEPDGFNAFALTFAASGAGTSGYDALAARTVQQAALSDELAPVIVATPASSTPAEGACTALTLRSSTEPWRVRNDADDGADAVTVDLATTDLEYGGGFMAAGDQIVATEVVTLDATTWSSGAVVQVCATDDARDDDGATFEVMGAARPTTATGFEPIAVPATTFTPADDDAAEVRMSGPASIAEGATASYRVTLASEPRGDVAVALALGGAHPEQLEPVAPLVAQLTRANWQSGVTLELRARQDDWKDGDLAATVVASASCASGGGCGYAGLASSALTVTNVDDEGAATLTLQVVGSPTRPTEAAGADHCVTVSVSASSRPFDGLAGDGTIVVDLAAAPTGATAVVTLDGAHWSGAGPGGSATFCAADDDIDNDSGGQPQDGLVTIVSATSSRGTDPAYGGIAATPLALTAIDDDVRGIVITGPTSLYEGASAEVVVRLASQPTGPVNVTVAGGSGDPTVLAFTPSTWRTPQPATIAAPDEDDDEHPEGAFATTVATATASGGDYTGTQAQHALDILEAGVCGTGVQIGLEECDGPDAGALASYACSELDAGNGTIACAACRWDTTPCWRARDLAVGARHACTLDTTGQLRCSVDAPDVSGLGALFGTYATLSSRAYGLTLDRTGFDADSPLASGAYFTCGFTSGAPTCIGALDRDSDGVAELAPGGIAWSATELIGAGPRHACALAADGSVSCWGDAKGFAPADWPTWTPSGVNVTALAAGLERSCACVDGSVECWGDLDYDRDGHQDATPATSCTALAAGDDFACALRADATITCWGAYPTPIPSGAYARIAAFGGHVCAAQASANANPGQVDCWGSVASAYPASTEGLVERLGFDDHAGATAETYYASGTCDASLHDQARFDDVTATSGSGSLELDGAGDYADFASCSDLIAGWHEATVELWFRADSLPSVVGTRMALVSLTDSNLLINDVFALDLVRFPDGVHLHGLARNGGSVAEPTSPVGLVAAGTWYHLALVVSDSGDSASLYLDGNLVATGTWLPTTIGQTTRHVRIGTAGEPAANWFDGHIDELRIHQRALSPTEIGQGRALQR